jgi:anti-sigma factor RsiW
VSCNDIQNMTVPYLELDMEPERVREITAHLDRCPACRTEMEAVRQVLVRVKQRRVPDPGERFWKAFPESVRTGLLRERMDAAAVPQDRRSSGRLWAGRAWSYPWSWALAASVLILLFAGIFLADLNRPMLTGNAVTGGQGSDLGDFAEADWVSTWDEDDSDMALARMAARLDRQALDRLFTGI